MYKKGGIQISFRGIFIVLILIVVVVFGISFIRNLGGGSQMKFEEQISREPDPPIPMSSDPISFSRGKLVTASGNIEAVKIGILNPTNKNWTFRDAIEDDDFRLCGKGGDSVCYVNTGCTKGNKCNTDSAALANDPECVLLDNGDGVLDFNECGPPNSPPDGICFMDNIDCLEFADPDCAPTEGIRLVVECSSELSLKTRTNPKAINAGETKVFTALLEVKEGVPEGTYLCSVSVVGEDIRNVNKDLTVRVS